MTEISSLVCVLLEDASPCSWSCVVLELKRAKAIGDDFGDSAQRERSFYDEGEDPFLRVLSLHFGSSWCKERHRTRLSLPPHEEEEKDEKEKKKEAEGFQQSRWQQRPPD